MAYDAQSHKQEIEKAIKESKSMMEASKKLNFNIKTFRRMAVELNLWEPNPSGKGTKRSTFKPKYDIEKIFSNELPMQSNKLRKRLLREGYKKPVCEMCSGTVWLGKPMPLELHHIDGNNKNNSLANLKLICPNCHTFTETYKSKNKKSKS